MKTTEDWCKYSDSFYRGDLSIFELENYEIGISQKISLDEKVIKLKEVVSIIKKLSQLNK